jgi:hypothetical protein
MDCYTGERKKLEGRSEVGIQTYRVSRQTLARNGNATLCLHPTILPLTRETGSHDTIYLEARTLCRTTEADALRYFYVYIYVQHIAQSGYR